MTAARIFMNNFTTESLASAMTELQTGVIHFVGRDPGFAQLVGRVADMIGARLTFSGSGDSLLMPSGGDPCCAIIEMSDSGLYALDFQRELQRRHIELPIIMVGSRVDVRTVVAAMEAGALTFMEDPIDLDSLATRVRQALDQDRVSRSERERRESICSRYSRLTAKEREVVERVLSGLTNREIAADLGISVRAVEDRRSRIMRRMQADSLVHLVDLVREAERAESIL